MPRFLISVSDEDAEMLKEWNARMDLGWTVKQCVESALERGLSGIELEVSEYIVMDEQEETDDVDA